ncbi:MAG: hypothetical protein LBT04_07005 [Prevotellaceae bacterium]|nr:hypothetical protein [Prevotellaceae bacterium]
MNNKKCELCVIIAFMSVGQNVNNRKFHLRLKMTNTSLLPFASLRGTLHFY